MIHLACLLVDFLPNLKILYPNGNGQNFKEKRTLCNKGLFSLRKNYLERPNYRQLLEHPFLQRHAQQETDVSSFFKEVLDLPDEELKTSKKTVV